MEPICPNTQCLTAKIYIIYEIYDRYKQEFLNQPEQNYLNQEIKYLKNNPILKSHFQSLENSKQKEFTQQTEKALIIDILISPELLLKLNKVENSRFFWNPKTFYIGKDLEVFSKLNKKFNEDELLLFLEDKYNFLSKNKKSISPTKMSFKQASIIKDIKSDDENNTINTDYWSSNKMHLLKWQNQSLEFPIPTAKTMLELLQAVYSEFLIKNFKSAIDIVSQEIANPKTPIETKNNIVVELLHMGLILNLYPEKSEKNIQECVDMAANLINKLGDRFTKQKELGVIFAINDNLWLKDVLENAKESNLKSLIEPKNTPHLKEQEKLDNKEQSNMLKN